MSGRLPLYLSHPIISRFLGELIDMRQRFSLDTISSRQSQVYACIPCLLTTLLPSTPTSTLVLMLTISKSSRTVAARTGRLWAGPRRLPAPLHGARSFYPRGEASTSATTRWLSAVALPTRDKKTQRPLQHRLPQSPLRTLSDAAEPTSTFSSETTRTTSEGSRDRFEDLSLAKESHRSLKEVFGYEFMTPVQQQTIREIVNGVDCLAKAKTGTGKTLGFLVPAVERMVRHHTDRKSFEDTSCLILSPTRELALQIASEAKRLLQFHNFRVVCCVGGTSVRNDAVQLSNHGAHLLVATPGRLLDLLANHRGVASRMDNLQVLTFDEADRLLDIGFKQEIESILDLLEPSRAVRQTLMFSATVSKSVQDIARQALRKGYQYIDTVGEDEDPTHSHVPQELMVAKETDQMAAIASILERETAKKPYKIMVFFTTTKLTSFAAAYFRCTWPDYHIIDIHSRKTQASRQKASATFRKTPSAVLFSSDVSARGMDYPDVTCVLQVGLTDRDQYIHRLGRTARAGKAGKGTLLLSSFEEKAMKRELRDMPLRSVPVPPMSSNVKELVEKATTSVAKYPDLQSSANQTYTALLGYYKSQIRMIGFGLEQLVHVANQWAVGVGLPEQPRLSPKLAGNIGVRGTPGLLLRDNYDRQQSFDGPSEPRRGSISRALQDYESRRGSFSSMRQDSGGEERAYGRPNRSRQGSRQGSRRGSTREEQAYGRPSRSRDGSRRGRHREEQGKHF